MCSDTRAGRDNEDATLAELEIPVTTDRAAIAAALAEPRPDAMMVVFSTYQSLPVVAEAQANGAPAFDLALCDEAHRTTGVERPGDDASPFVLVHDAARVKAARRLYMTATPRLYTEGARRKAARHDVEVFSMDDEATYGPEFHRLPFSRAVEQDLLSDYKVVVLAMSEVAYRRRPAGPSGGGRAARSRSTTRPRSSAAGARFRTPRPGAAGRPARRRPAPFPAPSPSPTPSGPPNVWRSTGTASSNTLSSACPTRNGPPRSAATSAMWTASTTRSNAASGSSG